MGVQGLWELLSPVGRRVSVETLAGKKVAIDASIWMIQFMKAMRDDRGEMVRNAHLLGFFRRICKLLYLKTKPVFVFDGGTPALKRRTVIARRRQRENAQAKIRKTAEKLLLNQIKQMRLKELAKDLENQRKNQKGDVKGKGKLASGIQGDVESGGPNNEMMKEMSGRSSAGKDGGLTNTESTSAEAVPSADDNGDCDEEIILEEINGVVDPDVFAALPPSFQRNILRQKDSKGKKKLGGEMDQLESERTLEQNQAAPLGYNQEKLDQMLAASLMAEEDRNLTNNTSTSAATMPFEEDADEDEEMIFPAMHGNIDPAVLAALPPSMQLDLLVQMRERLMAENRQKYQKVKKAPEKFSELQIQSYLKTVAFRREINEVQKAAAGTGVGGIQTSRIASEANREFIYSSSFTGDKQELTSARPARNEDKQQHMPPKLATESLNNFVSSSSSNNVAAFIDESRSTIDEDVETYVDERGRVRLSRARAMGIRMTRDLERNLDLMKEFEQERTHSKTVNVDSILDKDGMGPRGSTSGKNQLLEPSHDSNSEAAKSNNSNMQSTFMNEASMEISFEDDVAKNNFDADDEIFARLVAGDLVTTVPSPEKSPSKKQSSDFDSDFEWEEDVDHGKCGLENVVNVEAEPSIKEGDISDEYEVEWEDESSDAPKTSSGTSEQVKTLSKGYLQEEADLQEAVRRSIMELRGEESNYPPSGQKKPKGIEDAVDGTEILCEENRMDESSSLRVNDPRHNESQSEIAVGVEKLCGADGASILVKCNFPEGQTKSSLVIPLDNQVEVNIPSEQYHDSRNAGGQSACIANKCSEDTSNNLDAVVGDLPETILSDDKKNDQSVMINDTKPNPEVGPSIVIEERKNEFESNVSYNSVEITDSSIPVSKSTSDICIEQKLSGEGIDDKYKNINVREHSIDDSAVKDNHNEQFEFTEASLEEELLILGQEHENLGHEQRKLERNAEGVSSEMFAECQELLQMFGLPYIIAPMEAEAQCAYMELANLVDGVVTDDSDVFLFGARSVYKNIFDERKYVETYFMEDIEKELGLSREKLIRMALLLGSDYTEGVSGIGIVNAIEVVNAFPEEDGLLKFREWIESPDPSILGTFNGQGGSSKRKKDKEAEVSKQFGENMDPMKQIFMDKHRNVSKNWHIPPSFPSEAVIMAYFSPQVDKSTEPFTWGKPDLSVLRKLCWEKFGWGGQKSDELLVPVLKEYEKREIQLRLEAFYSFNERFAKIRSKRIKKAVKGITGKQNSELMDDVVQKASTSRKRVKDGPVNSINKKSRKPSAKSGDVISGNQSNSVEESIPEQSGDWQDTGNPVQSEIRNAAEAPLQADGGQNARKQSRGGGRGRGRRGRRGRGRGSLVPEQSDAIHSDGSSDSDELEVHSDMLQQQQEPRRSTRSRNKVNYAASDQETDEVGMTPNYKGNSSGEAMEHDSFVAEEVRRDNAAGSLADESLHQVPDPPSVEAFSSEYLEKGGGFCADEDEDEAEASHPGANSDLDPSFEDPLFKEYLQTGGGFCVDEDETNNDQEASYHPDTSRKSDFIEVADDDVGPSETTSSPKRTTYEHQNIRKTSTSDSTLNVEGQHPVTDTELTKSPLPDNSKTDWKMFPPGALSAIPNLKKKRRKN